MNAPSPLNANGRSKAALKKPSKAWTVRSKNLPQRQVRSVPLTRRYEVSWLNDAGEIEDFVRVAPALPIFEQAFSAFSHGALIGTTEGPVAVEDLVPGMEIETLSGLATLRWVGAITIVPGATAAKGEPDHLYRVTADAFGLGRPASGITFGPAARLLNRTPAIRNALGAEAALAPVSTFADGATIVEITPVSPIRVYHLAFDTHQIIKANGIEVESYHPGPDAHYSMSIEMRAMFVALFPQITAIHDFGRMLWPRFEAGDDLEGLV
ncbi:MAG: hypothetical protein HKN63_12200 [Rhodobacteraceae bacterium]|nr:hypothetical protein [Paracoccaceae bacterium]